MQSSASEVSKAVRIAISAGYRHIDCAFSHGNEFSVGVALKNQIVAEGFPRRKLFVTSKVCMLFHRKPALALVHISQETTCARKLYSIPSSPKSRISRPISDQLASVSESNVLHSKYSMKNMHFQPGARQPSGEPEYDSVPIEETWEAMEQLVQMGLVRSIGLSNFNEEQIRRVLGCCSIPPAVLQVESHPYFLNSKLINFAQRIGMKVTACAPLGSSYTEPKGDVCHLLDDPIVGKIAKVHNKSPAQVILRHGLQRNLIVIPKSVTPERIRENINIFDFELTEDEMSSLNSLDKGQRFMDQPE
ncbi:unnamed protein product [Schistocephalus solidus]|uniref:NADP-dependent oxidoreductase domain-containing protein n=1 Tax=Schistocephalus solidus TaxID=70667 RepID=A0A3P7CQZ2_SCHSO|nr:unnamed protein product [Schistocephalus solidus]